MHTQFSLYPRVALFFQFGRICMRVRACVRARVRVLVCVCVCVRARTHYKVVVHYEAVVQSCRLHDWQIARSARLARSACGGRARTLPQ
jgi:hypothetical protein